MKIRLDAIARIQNSQLELGDFNILTGPQATGKSIFLQLLKLGLDAGDIAKTIKKYGYEWGGDNANFQSLYLGEGLNQTWTQKSQLLIDDKPINLTSIRGTKKPESVFLIPAQRVMMLKSGWPRPFTDYDSGDPFVLRNYSEHIRLLMEAGLGGGKEGSIFPQIGRLKQFLRDSLNQNIYNGAEIKLDLTSGHKKRVVLQLPGGSKLPFTVWSAGQREFTPLLLGLYWLLPSTKTIKRKEIQWVFIEEPEMGLHPNAIMSVFLLLLELSGRGYKIIVSTHSPLLLDIVWGIRNIKKQENLFLKMFSLKKNQTTSEFANNIMENVHFKAFYFNPQNSHVQIEDISELDPGHENENIAEWGGLTKFSTRISDIVAEAN